MGHSAKFQVSAAIIAVLIGGTAASGGEMPPIAEVFANGADGYPVYRIPSLVCTPKGVLLAFCEARRGDDQSPTDMVLKRSLDGGKTWMPMQVIVRAAPDLEAAMNPTAIVDRHTGEVVLVYDRWPKRPEGEWGSFTRKPGLGRDSITTWVTTSSDDGATWSTPLDITATTKKPEWRETGHGPGLGIQMRSGRLVVPCFEIRPDEKSIWGVSWNFAIYSDDHGKTWRLSDNEVGPGVNETQVVELADGTLVLNMRSDSVKGCRIGASSRDGGKTWSEPFDIRELPDTGCQASILRYSWGDESGGKSRILFCNPVKAGRTEGTVRLSYDEGKSWPVAKVICTDYFGYSCLTVMPDGAIGCIYEADSCRKIVFQRFSLEWLTNGKD